MSFHLECLLCSLPDALFAGGPADYITAVLGHLANTPAIQWYATRMPTPCGDRDIFTSTEWGAARWLEFHQSLVAWAQTAAIARSTGDRNRALDAWQVLLGDDFFPREVAR